MSRVAHIEHSENRIKFSVGSMNSLENKKRGNSSGKRELNHNVIRVNKNCYDKQIYEHDLRSALEEHEKKQNVITDTRVLPKFGGDTNVSGFRIRYNGDGKLHEETFFNKKGRVVNEQPMHEGQYSSLYRDNSAASKIRNDLELHNCKEFPEEQITVSNKTNDLAKSIILESKKDIDDVEMSDINTESDEKINPDSEIKMREINIKHSGLEFHAVFPQNLENIHIVQDKNNNFPQGAGQTYFDNTPLTEIKNKEGTCCIKFKILMHNFRLFFKYEKTDEEMGKK